MVMVVVNFEYNVVMNEMWLFYLIVMFTVYSQTKDNKRHISFMTLLFSKFIILATQLKTATEHLGPVKRKGKQILSLG